MADKNAIQDLLSDEIKDLYSAERQLTKAIPKMARGSNDASLKAAFTAHLTETQHQVSRAGKGCGASRNQTAREEVRGNGRLYKGRRGGIGGRRKRNGS
jgi:ferritin-like metal-binding protein YciE